MAQEKVIQPIKVATPNPSPQVPSMIPKTSAPTNVANFIDNAKQAGQPQATAPTAGIVAPPTAKDVLGEANVTQALTDPAQVPVETPVAPTGLETKKQELADLMNTIRVGGQAIEQQNEGAMGTTGTSLNMIVGQKARFEEANLNKARFLQDQIDIEEAKQDEMKSLMLQAPGAGISSEDSFEDAIRKTAEWQLKEETRKLEREEALIIRGETRAEERGIRAEERAAEREEERLKDMQKADLKNMALSLGLDTSGSSNELRKRIAKSTAKDRALNDRMNDLALKIKQESYRKSMQAEKDENIDTNTTISSEFNNSSNTGNPNSTVTGEPVYALGQFGFTQQSFQGPVSPAHQLN